MGGGLLPNDTGSWEVANSNICVAIAGLADRLLALVLGLPPLPVLGLGTGKKRRKKGGRSGERERGGGNGELPVVLVKMVLTPGLSLSLSPQETPCGPVAAGMRNSPSPDNIH